VFLRRQALPIWLIGSGPDAPMLAERPDPERIDSFSSISWMICAKEFMVLEDNRTNAFRDVPQIPPDFQKQPQTWLPFCAIKAAGMSFQPTRRGELMRRSPRGGHREVFRPAARAAPPSVGLS
jgi:hypothetical protein